MTAVGWLTTGLFGLAALTVLVGWIAFGVLSDEIKEVSERLIDVKVVGNHQWETALKRHEKLEASVAELGEKCGYTYYSLPTLTRWVRSDPPEVATSQSRTRDENLRAALSIIREVNLASSAPATACRLAAAASLVEQELGR